MVISEMRAWLQLIDILSMQRKNERLLLELIKGMFGFEPFQGV